jgi:spore maturation protein CgeB
LGQSRARQIGTSALERVLSEHTYQHRAEQLQQLLDGRLMVERVEDAA